MKRKILYFVTGLAIFGLATLQSCNNEDTVTPTEFYAFTTPVVVAPADGETIKITGTTQNLTWESSTKDGSAISADVYFGTSEDPELYAAGVNGLAINVPVELGLTYYWHVVMRDINNITTEGPTWSFTVFEPIGIFVGDYIADEPAEDYSYDISFTKGSATELLTDNYWNSGWNATFNMNFTANTYSMPSTTWTSGYSGIESGTIDPATGTMVGDYTIYRNGVAIETGVHTYTKK